MDKRETTVVVLGHFAWDTHFMQFHKGVMAELRRDGMRVVWVDDRIRARRDGLLFWIRAIGHGHVTEDEELVRMRPWTLPMARIDDFRLSSWLTARQVRRALKTYAATPDVVLSYAPTENRIVAWLAPSTLLYWTGDEVVLPGEDWLFDRADAILAISDQAVVTSEARAPGRVHRFSTGVDLRRFAATGEVPSELRDLPRPLLGYAGGLSPERVDVAMLRAVAEGNPSASVVLIGPEAPEFSAELKDLPDNVVRLGPRPYADMPDYIAAFDVGLVPYVVNEFNKGSDPLKVHEYLAAGLPVVSTRLPAVEEYGDLVAVADTPGDFATNATAAASTRHGDELIERRRSAVADKGLDRIASSIAEIIELTSDKQRARSDS